MDYKQHLLFSLVINGVVLSALYFLGFATPAVLASPWILAAYLVFSLLPDIDSRTSMMSRIFFVFVAGILILSVIGIIMGGEVTALSGMGILVAIGLFLVHMKISKADRTHRSFPHTILFGAAACAIFFLASGSILASMAAAISFLSHLVADEHIRLA